MPSTNTMRRAVDAGEHAAGVLGPRFRRRVRRRRERLGVAHQRAQVGVLPLLDAPVRQAGASKRRNAASRRRRGGGAGKPRAQRREGLDEARLRRRS